MTATTDMLAELDALIAEARQIRHGSRAAHMAAKKATGSRPHALVIDAAAAAIRQKALEDARAIVMRYGAASTREADGLNHGEQ